MLGIHAVVGGHGDDATHFIELCEVAIHHFVESVGLRGSGCVLVLNIVGGRKIHDVGAIPFHDLDTGGEYKLGQVGRVNLWQRQADKIEDSFDAMFRQRDPVGGFGRKADCRAVTKSQILP